jgi:dienelactone hydrolase
LKRRWTTTLLVTAAALWADLVGATTVSELAAIHRSGQTFLTWTVPSPGTWTYRVYASSDPVLSTADLDQALLVGTVGDSTWMDRRLSKLLGGTVAFSRDSAGPPLPETAGMFVHTVSGSGLKYYAVTAQPVGDAEHRGVTVGANALETPVWVEEEAPRPVWQRETISEYGALADVYVLWTWNEDRTYGKATSSQDGWAFHSAVVRGAAPPDNRLFLRGHGRGGSFLQATWGFLPTDWRLSFDDHLPNKDVASFYYGYHEQYVLDSNGNPIPSSGVVRGYTHACVLHVLDWALANFPIDRDRVYAMGHSMGATFCVFAALTAGDRIAAVWANVPKLDLSDFRNSVLYEGMFTPMWGDTATNLPTDDGIPVYDRLNAAAMAARVGTREPAPILSFAGREDTTMGWAEKVSFYGASEANRLGGVHFWDRRAHVGPGGMDAMGSLSELFRYRLDHSWPAFSNASCNQDPGDGDPAVGDSIGSINGFLDWDTSTVDYEDRWGIVLRTRPIQTRGGTWPAPEVVTVDVTPRRLQNFVLIPGQTIEWSVKRLSDSRIVQGGLSVVDSTGHVTAYGVEVHGSGTHLSMGVPGSLDVGTPQRPRPRLTLDRAPVVRRAIATATWSGSGDASLALYDLSGRRVRTLHAGPARGSMRFEVDGAGLAAGVYFLAARQDGRSSTLRFVLLR